MDPRLLPVSARLRVTRFSDAISSILGLLAFYAYPSSFAWTSALVGRSQVIEKVARVNAPGDLS